MSTHEKLLPCFVCGGEARLSRDGYSLELRVMCDECGARTEDFETDKEAIAAWNRRTPPPAAESDDAIYANLLAVITDIRHKTGVGGKPMLSELADAIAEKIKAGSPPAAVPEGWVLVPREPTPEMRSAALQDHLPKSPDDPPLYESVWRAMISAAPAAPNGWQPISTEEGDE